MMSNFDWETGICNLSSVKVEESWLVVECVSNLSRTYVEFHFFAPAFPLFRPSSDIYVLILYLSKS